VPYRLIDRTGRSSPSDAAFAVVQQPQLDTSRRNWSLVDVFVAASSTCARQPRHEPGRKRDGTEVPSVAALPQRQAWMALPASPGQTAAVPAISGTSVTTFVSIVESPKPCAVTVTLPLDVVAIDATYFDVDPGLSQPQLPEAIVVVLLAL
jgi:hypothetical protein